MRDGTIVFIVILLLSLFSTATASGQDLVIYTEHSPYAQYVDEEDGRPKGYVYELVLEIQRRMQDDTPIHFVPWARGYQQAMNRPNTALFSTTFTEERRPLFKWVGPVLESVWVLYAAADADVVIESLDDARVVQRVGTYRDDVREKYLLEQGFTNLDSAPDNESNFRKLLAGRINLWISSRGMAERMARKLGYPEDSVKQVHVVAEKGLFIAFHKDTSVDIVEQWTQAYAQVREDGTMQAIFDRWNVELPRYLIPPGP